MGYRDNISQSKQKVYEKAVATKILDLMDKLRLSNNENNRRRWIWELLQNAKDVKSRKRDGVDIVVDLKDRNSTLAFKHNGRCFSSDNITFLIEQVSTKERSDESAEETTGKFGTGFLTTHLLSEVVEIRGIVKDEGLPHRKFCISLDRSGTDLEKIIASVNNSLEQLDQLENAEDFEDYDEREFNTAFTYHLDQNGLSTATIGIKDLENSLPLTLVFLPSILSVRVDNRGATYHVSKTKDIGSIRDLSIQQWRVEVQTKEGESLYDFMSIKDSLCQIAVPVCSKDSSIVIVDTRKGIVPRLFCDFPLVGSEGFGIPFVVNSSHFHPTEPRDGIFLTDIGNEKIESNKQILKVAVSRYLDFIEYAASHQWGNLYQLANITVPAETEWLSKKWHKENILLPIQKKVYEIPLVRTENGSYLALKEGDSLVNIPFGDREEIREGIWDLVYRVACFRLPAKEDIHCWYRIFNNTIWDKVHRLDISTLTKHITQDRNNLKELGREFDISDPITWLNQFFNVLQMAEEDPLDFLENSEHKIFPNQRGEFCLPSNLRNDGGIEVALKDVGDCLLKNYYGRLAHRSIEISQLLPTKNQESVISEINQALQSEKVDLKHRKSACYALTRLFPKEEFESTESRKVIYDISVKLFNAEIPSKLFIDSWSSEIWSVSDRMQAEFIVEEISAFQNLHKLSTHLKEENSETLEWLSVLALLFLEMEWNELLGNASPILPNQNGTFCELSELFVEGELIDESLKDIAASLRKDFRDDLIDNAFNVPIPKTRKVFQKDIGSKIRDLVSPRLSELSRTDETQKIFNQLILWMDDNPDIAEEIFGDLYENRHKLYDDVEVARNLRKVRELEDENQSLKLHNEQLQTELEELKAQLSVGMSGDEAAKELLSEKKQEIDDAFLIIHGVTSREKLETILADPETALRYSYSDPSDYFSRLEYVLEIIDRAKRNVRAFLESLDDYDCSEWRECSETYIVGVKKWGNPIKIIVRPSDNRKIIFYYPEEKQVLSGRNSELWVEDDIAKPHQFTLGDVLRIAAIDYIDLPIDF
ncbi:hypothetical protein H6F88_17595 [Oculatella sp. FACHB-28]|uniref:sacsin N-terminal ATP-binding-like domain-containing protein n=1 Tax=Oculatella sp. FACHB-28 TaxID=2692845 RepID=UPI00168A203A|nr:hypothetical protein [Oculatella sp. FACHB-28]MBD2057811.1 hypothetical protein [Oculatella sp. FACHB-28]